jgi:hypothetical protein
MTPSELWQVSTESLVKVKRKRTVIGCGFMPPVQVGVDPRNDIIGKSFSGC